MSDETPGDDLTGNDGATGTADGDLPPEQIDRLFDLVEGAIEEDALTGDQLDRLLSILERAVGGTAGSDPESLAELLSALEEFVVRPDEVSEADIDGALSLFEEALAGVSAADAEDFADVFEMLEAGLRDPAALDPSDLEQFQSGIQDALGSVTDPSSGFGGLFSLPSFASEADPESPASAFRIARLAAMMTQRASGYTVESGIRAGTRFAYAAANAESLAELLTTARAITLDELRRAGIDIGEQRAAWLDAHEEAAVEARPLTREELAERGARLISRSAEVGRDESVHPAFGSILDQLSTDEARILRLLATEGPQGVVDIYDRQYLPPKSWRVARNLTMLGRDAGCRMQERTPVYVRNLQRLGVAEISDEPVENLKRYEIIEAQSHIDRAFDRARRPRTEYKRIQLTDLGVEFCELCFPFEVAVEGEGLAVRDAVGE